MAIVLDSNSPYYEDFTREASKNAVYLTGQDPLFGDMVCVIYQSSKSPHNKLSSLVLASHGTSGFVDMTLAPQSRYYSAVANLHDQHKSSLVRQALAIATLRSYATMDHLTRRYLDVDRNNWDETIAGITASNMKLVNGKFPDEIGEKVRQMGVVSAKSIATTLLDVVYVDSDVTIDKNNELVYLLGEQLEQLFDPLTEYSPEPAERLYMPPVDQQPIKEEEEGDGEQVQQVVGELFTLQEHFKTNLIEFLQQFLIPLRVKVLGNEVDGMTITKLNTIFPPTIDEIVRVNNIFFEALQQAAPYGKFEVVKACGMTIPYFYKACMRHEAATKNFNKTLKQYYTLFRQSLPKASGSYTPRIIESTIQCSTHLARVKLVLDRLLQAGGDWAPHGTDLVQEYYASAVGTIDAFGRESQPKYDRRVFTPTGKVLVEIAKGWPKELEYGWINRRVVTIFDALDVRTMDHHIVIIFTDQLVVLTPTEPIPFVSASGMHLPSIGDVLMHSMVNEMPLPQNIPELKVVGHVPIEQVVMAEYMGGKNLCIDLLYGATIKNKTQYLYQLVRPDHEAKQFVSMLTKAQVMNKSQPFHLFKNSFADLSIFATVHEIQGYTQEVHKTPVAVFMNVDITRDILRANNLSACFKVEFESPQMIRVQVFSSMGCGEFDRLVPLNEFAQTINAETGHLYSLHYSTKNKAMMTRILEANRDVVSYLSSYACTRTERKCQKVEMHKHKPVVVDIKEKEPAAKPRKITPSSILARFKRRVSDRPRTEIEHEQEEEEEEAPEMTRSDSSSSEEVFEFPPKRPHGPITTNTSKSAPPQLMLHGHQNSDEWEDVTSMIAGDDTSSFQMDDANVVVLSKDDDDDEDEEDEESINRPASIENVSEMASTEVDSDDERAQRDVSEWFKNYESSVDELSSFESDFEDSHLDHSGSTDVTPEMEYVEQEEAVRQLNKMFRNAPPTTPPPHDSSPHGLNLPTPQGTVRSSCILQRMDSCYNKALAGYSGCGEEDDDDVVDDSASVSTIQVSDLEDDPEYEYGYGQEPCSPQQEMKEDKEETGTLNINDDFGHLAKFWAYTSSNEDMKSKSSGKSLAMQRSNTSLCPGLRDPSIMFLGSYVHSRNSSSVGSDSTGGGGDALQMIREDESSSSSSLSPGGQQHEPLMSMSVTNLLRYSSANTLQLASFTVELDRLMEEQESRGQYQTAKELERVKQVLVSQYEQTRNTLSTDRFDAGHEMATRGKVRQLTWTVLGLMGVAESMQVVRGVLDMEVLRRVKLGDKFGTRYF